MVWKLTDKAKDQEPLPGVPWQDMEDEQFREVAKMYAAQGFSDRALHNSGFFEHVDDKPTASREKKGD